MNLAPIGLSTYKRKDHLAGTLAALARNTLARDSELFIFSDAPRPGDEQAVADVRQMAKAVSGFRRVRLVERGTNDRVENNRGGMRFLLREYGKMIFLEEDIVTAPAFLGFMNEGLDALKSEKDVFAVCGYTPSVGLEKVASSNIYSCRRFSAWGFGIWDDRFREIEMGQFSLNSLSRVQRRRLRSAGADLVTMVEQLSRGELEALDVRINVTLAKGNRKVVCPTKSLTVNRGHDGTGLHCGDTDYYETELNSESIASWNFDHVSTNRKIDSTLYFFRGRHRRSIGNLAWYALTRNLKFGQ